MRFLADETRELREPWSIVRRGLGSGAAGGALLGAAVQASDVAYRSWGSALFAAAVGAAVALPVALVAVVVFQWFERRSVRLAWLAGGLAAAAVVVAAAAVLHVRDAWFLALCAGAAFALALVAAPFVTTRRIRG